MALYPAAEKRLLPPGLNHTSGGMSSAIHGVIVHVIVGTLAAADSVFHNPARRASAHFGVDFDGHVVQWVDTINKAWAEGAGNSYWISIETAGRPESPLTLEQVRAVAAIVRWARDLYGFPLQVTDDPYGLGVGTHSMGGGAWGGHACPGSIRASQRAEIVRLATGEPVPQPLPPQEHKAMSIFVRGKSTATVYLLSGRPETVKLTPVGSEGTLAALYFAGWGHDVIAGFGADSTVNKVPVKVVDDSFVTELK